mmetsp:Transcript_19842/g.48070  ORF Transcript_19842/g.48070 Transcript_19842/m.48070 type:complete len:207 (-) Transcript_19842:50-670(-)
MLRGLAARKEIVKVVRQPRVLLESDSRLNLRPLRISSSAMGSGPTSSSTGPIGTRGARLGREVSAARLVCPVRLGCPVRQRRVADQGGCKRGVQSAEIAHAIRCAHRGERQRGAKREAAARPDNRRLRDHVELQHKVVVCVRPGILLARSFHLRTGEKKASFPSYSSGRTPHLPLTLVADDVAKVNATAQDLGKSPLGIVGVPNVE